MSTLRVNNPAVKAETSPMLALLRAVRAAGEQAASVLEGQHPGWDEADVRALAWQLDNFLSVLAARAPNDVRVPFDADSGDPFARVALCLHEGRRVPRRLLAQVGLGRRENKDLVV